MNDLIEVRTPIHGATCPDDHHYVLHSAVKTQCCRRLTERGWQLRCIQSGKSVDGIRVLENADAELRSRVPLEDLDDWRAIEDAPLRLGDHILVAGKTQVRDIEAHDHLVADCVVVSEPGRGYLGAQVGKRLGAGFGHFEFGIHIDDDVDVHVGDSTLHGCRVRLTGLSDKESLYVQRQGVGQKQSWGCGTFWPVDR